MAVRTHGPIFYGAMTRIKTGSVSDAKPSAILAMAATKTGNPGPLLAATGGSTSSIEDTGTWTAPTAEDSSDNVIGCPVMYLAGPNWAVISPFNFAIVEAQSANALTGMINPSTRAVFSDAFDNTTRYRIEPRGMEIAQNSVEAYITFSGGTNPTCKIKLWVWDAALENWAQVEQHDFTNQERYIYRNVGDGGREVYLQITDIGGSPTSVTVTAKGVEV